MNGPIPLRFDVTADLPTSVSGGKRIEIDSWLFLPERVPTKPIIVNLLAGGSYDKRYHHAVVPGREGYSAAEHLARAGHIVLLTDHLGVGESDRVPVQSLATRAVVAQANHAAFSQCCERLRVGDLVAEFPPVPHFARAGGGHSMGGMQIVTQQANHASYDAIMMIGYTVQGVHFTLGGRKARAADYVPDGPAPDYTSNDRAAQRENFHWSDVPPDVIAYDDTLAVETPTQIGWDSIRSGIIVKEAAQIEVPVLIALGERDVSPDPEAEAGFFPSSPATELYTLPRSAHCQSFAGTRHQFWDKLDNWLVQNLADKAA